jgi:hypothetical protein
MNILDHTNVLYGGAVHLEKTKTLF